jgi:hypothetical protein
MIGLWPFNFRPKNKVEWLKDKNGVRFYDRGIIYSEKENTIVPSFQSSDIPMKSITIEIWLQPESDSHPHLPRILSFYDGLKNEYFFVGQWRSHLILRTRVSGFQNKGIYREILFRDALAKGQRRLITITSHQEGTCIYVDDKMEKSVPDYTFLSIDRTMSTNFLLIGNSPNGKQYWTGGLFGLAIYKESLTPAQILEHFQGWTKRGLVSPPAEESLVALYPLAERSGSQIRDYTGHLHPLMPSVFKVFQRDILVPAWKDFQLNRSYLMDILTNILGFISFGFCFSAFLWLRRSRSIYHILLFSIFLTGIVSLSIELIQAYLPTRESQLIDVIMNTIGAAIGASLSLKNPKP